MLYSTPTNCAYPTLQVKPRTCNDQMEEKKIMGIETFKNSKWRRGIKQKGQINSAAPQKHKNLP